MRRSFAGERGQSRFAGQLGLSPSTYGNYEKGRDPPPHVLARVAELTGADLVWLLTGRPGSAGPRPGRAADWSANPQQRAILERAARLLADRPANLAAFAAFLDLLAEKTLLEQSLGLAVRGGVQQQAAFGTGPTAAAAERAARAAQPIAGAAKPTGGPAEPTTRPVNFGRWVPVFGRAAAGLARFWAELAEGDASAAPEPSALDRMIHEAAELSDADSHLAVLELAPGAPGPVREQAGRGRGRPRSTATGPRRDIRVRLVQLSEPITDYQLTEFLEAPELADRYRPLFGLRLDGDSMEPMFPDGTVVLCCPSEPARAGGPAVVRLAGQIGLTCKLYRPRGAMVRLVSANDKYPAQEFPARQLDWALAVLGSVRVD